VRSLGFDEAEVLRRLDSLLERRVLTRFGPMFQIERAGGAFVLAAMRVPEADFERVAGQVNAFPEVAHNYRREHELNMWFVLATATPQGIAEGHCADRGEHRPAGVRLPQGTRVFRGDETACLKRSRGRNSMPPTGA
jgi:DNA-binding Lrp family transcriptional regulator